MARCGHEAPLPRSVRIRRTDADAPLSIGKGGSRYLHRRFHRWCAMELDPDATIAAHVSFDISMSKIPPAAPPTILQRISALNDALIAYETAPRKTISAPIGTDRRTVADRRVSARASQAQEIAGAIAVAVVPPDQRQAQARRVYDMVPDELKAASGLTLDHVALTLDALR